jgi:DNA (cytosine-5)-methyltransferase 1
MHNMVFSDLVEDIPTGVPWHPRAETDRLIGMMAPRHIAKLEAAKRAGKRMIGAYFKRMREEVQRVEIRFDDIAGCLRVPSGGSSRQDIMIVDGAMVRSRLLSPREAARLMGLPDSYKLPVNVNEALGLVGDGVVVPVVRHLAENVLEPVLQVHRQGAR